MERSRVHKRPPLLVPTLVILAALIVLYVPVRVRMTRSWRSQAPAPGTALSVFFTNQLAGYREPCG